MWFFVKIKLYNRKILKKDVSIRIDVIIICELFIKIFDKLFDGKKPPEEIIVIAKFNELKALTLKILRIIKIPKVMDEYSKKILKDCFKISALLNEIKLVNDFLKL